MIFVTVGAQMPFDRLICAVDDWAGKRGREDVVAQIGKTGLRPAHIQWTAFLMPDEFRQRVAQADIVIAHAGMGSIITALELGKPILVMPRRGHLNETRNDHQVDTARQFLAQGRIEVALDEAELAAKLEHLEDMTGTRRSSVSATAAPQLIQAIRKFVEANSVVRK
jgi:UDP-N-acetylglucosamine transferase subunit ALG13